MNDGIIRAMLRFQKLGGGGQPKCGDLMLPAFRLAPERVIPGGRGVPHYRVMEKQRGASPTLADTPNRPRPRKARGQDRPQYLDSPDLDRVVLMMTSLMSEVSALRDRLDTHEALGAQGVIATVETVEAYHLTPERELAREAVRDAMLTRVLRVLYEERDASPLPKAD